MKASSVLSLLSLASGSLAWEWGKSGKWDNKLLKANGHGTATINYTTITGFFQQDDPATDASTFDYTKSNFGLINRTYPTDSQFDPQNKRTQWERFAYYVDTLNRDSDSNSQYKVLFMGRHGEGYHNAAESFYGTPAWNCYWGPLDGNGTVTWRDAHLTAAGIAQCTKAREFWTQALAASKMPAPQSYYSSPLARSATTANLTFASLPLPRNRPFAPVVKEGLREGVSIRTCDARSDRAALAAALPRFRFEPGFAERDELWRGDEGQGETADAHTARTRAVLDDVFAADPNTWISITSHSGQIAKNLLVLGHRAFGLSTGQAIPVLVKARTLSGSGTTTTTTAAGWSAEATCRAPPVTSIAGQGCVCASTVATATAV
ncbi:histidine phosphatase superfamily [Biscogniauxia mediterranea]|nr:histidine phosphatase superfamily [Biscogniauxia mediterranea]